MNRLPPTHLTFDLFLVVTSLLIAIILSTQGWLEAFIGLTPARGILGSFLGGFFFVSVFTAAPAAILILEVAGHTHPLIVAGVGALGSVVGDLVIYRFVKSRLSQDIIYLLGLTPAKRLRAFSRLRLTRFLLPLLGALVIASPLPDELGVLMLGASRLPQVWFVPLSFALNYLGILAIAAAGS